MECTKCCVCPRELTGAKVYAMECCTIMEGKPVPFYFCGDCVEKQRKVRAEKCPFNCDKDQSRWYRKPIQDDNPAYTRCSNEQADELSSEESSSEDEADVQELIKRTSRPDMTEAVREHAELSRLTLSGSHLTGT